ncbi:MAG: MazG nucleotide pyrophosphohydrolase domain-containing protein [Candidatus Omnitrophica bacterium]|nr:MazG nucleotide pyrophosphohydrolase domain-containing protein [Candidatus Omnitrophota bacterium]
MKEFDNLVKTVRLLRSPGGCPWDRAQRLRDYKKYLLEETYELIEELNENKYEAVKEELGDLFLILIIMSEMLREKRKYTLQEVLLGINNKLVQRHPHVFSTVQLKNKEAVLRYWIKHKAKAKKRKTVKERLPKTAPALFLADLFLKEYEKIHSEKAANTGVEDLISAITHDLKNFNKRRGKETNLGSALFSLSKLARLYRLDLENILRKKIFRLARKTTYQSKAE